MWSLPLSDSAESLSKRLAATWQQQNNPVNAKKTAVMSLEIAIAKAFGGPYLVAGIFKCIYDCLSFLQPQLLRLLLRFVSSYNTDKAMPSVAGFAIIVLMFITENIAIGVSHQYFDRCRSTCECRVKAFH